MEEVQENMCAGVFRSKLVTTSNLLQNSDGFTQRNTKLAWDETIQTLTELFEQVWGNQDIVALDHCLEITFPVSDNSTLIENECT